MVSPKNLLTHVLSQLSKLDNGHSRPKFLTISGPKQVVNAVGIRSSVFETSHFCRHVNRVILLDTALEYVTY